jgi:AcrR family transcriptional regulator
MDNNEKDLNKKEPHQKRAIETREKLIAAAVELFNEKGFYDTTTKDISKRAGVSIGIFYNYFEDKSKIYYESMKLSYDVGNANLFRLVEEIFIDGISKKKVYDYFYDGLQYIRSRIRLISERDRIMRDYPEIHKLAKEREKEAAKIIAEHLLGENSEIAGKLLMETVNRNSIAITAIEDSEEQEKYIRYLADMIYYFCVELEKKHEE